MELWPAGRTAMDGDCGYQTITHRSHPTANGVYQSTRTRATAEGCAHMSMMYSCDLFTGAISVSDVHVHALFVGAVITGDVTVGDISVGAAK